MRRERDRPDRAGGRGAAVYAEGILRTADPHRKDAEKGRSDGRASGNAFDCGL